VPKSWTDRANANTTYLRRSATRPGNVPDGRARLLVVGTTKPRIRDFTRPGSFRSGYANRISAKLAAGTGPAEVHPPRTNTTWSSRTSSCRTWMGGRSLRTEGRGRWRRPKPVGCGVSCLLRRWTTHSGLPGGLGAPRDLPDQRAVLAGGKLAGPGARGVRGSGGRRSPAE